jgi:DNA-binding transcriptional LysR family regulator
MSIRVVRQAAPRFRLKALPVKEATWLRHVGVIYRDGGYLSPAAKRLIEILKSTAREISKRT